MPKSSQNAVRKLVQSVEQSDSMIQLHPEFITKGGKKKFAVLTYEEFCSLTEFLEDVEDLLDLRKAKKLEGKKNTVSLEKVKIELGL